MHALTWPVEISRLENTIAHLERSNAELEEAHAEDTDPLYVSTIDSNKGVMSVAVFEGLSTG